MVSVKDRIALKFRLEVLSPVHIGTGNTLTLWDFAIRSNYLFVLNHDEFFNFLRKEGKLEQAISAMESGQGKADDFLGQWIPENLIRYRLYIDPSIKDPQKNIKRVLEAIKHLNLDSSGKLRSVFYIPATEVKGYVRTAIIYCYLRDNWQRFRNRFSNINRGFDFKRIIENDIFGDAVEDPMKYLKTEDIYGDFDTNVVGVKILFSSRNFIDSAEAILKSKSKTIKVVIDKGRLNQGIGTYIKNWTRCCYEFTKDLIEAEIKFWEDVRDGVILRIIKDQRIQYRFRGNHIKSTASEVINQLEKIKENNSKSSPVIRIGRFTGYLFHTVSALLNGRFQQYTHQNQPYNVAPIGDQIGARNAKQCLFPLTRRLTLDNQTLGWCRLVEAS